MTRLTHPASAGEESWVWAISRLQLTHAGLCVGRPIGEGFFRQGTLRRGVPQRVTSPVHFGVKNLPKSVSFWSLHLTDTSRAECRKQRIRCREYQNLLPLQVFQVVPHDESTKWFAQSFPKSQEQAGSCCDALNRKPDRELASRAAKQEVAMEAGAHRYDFKCSLYSASP